MNNILPTALAILVVLWHIQNLHALESKNSLQHGDSDFYFEDALKSSQKSTSSANDDDDDPSRQRIGHSPSPGEDIHREYNNPEKSASDENIFKKLQDNPSLLEKIDITGMLKFLQQMTSLLNPLKAIKTSPVEKEKDYLDGSRKLNDSSTSKSKNPTGVFSGTPNAKVDRSVKNEDISLAPNFTGREEKYPEVSTLKRNKPKALTLNTNEPSPAKNEKNPTDNRVKSRNGTRTLKSADRKVNTTTRSASRTRGYINKQNDTIIKHSSGYVSNNDTGESKDFSHPNPQLIVERKIRNDSAKVTLKSKNRGQGTTAQNTHNTSHPKKRTANKDKLNVAESKPIYMKLFTGPVPENEFVDEYVNKPPRRNVPKKGSDVILPAIRKYPITLNKSRPNSSISDEKNETLKNTESLIPHERRMARQNETDPPSKDSTKTQTQLPPQNAKEITGKLKSLAHTFNGRPINCSQLCVCPRVKCGKTDDKINKSNSTPSPKNVEVPIRPSPKNSNFYEKLLSRNYDRTKAATTVQKFKGKVFSDNTSSLLPHQNTFNNNSKDVNNVSFQKDVELPRAQKCANETNSSSFSKNSHNHPSIGNPGQTEITNHFNHTKTSMAHHKLKKERNSTDYHSGSAKVSKQQSDKAGNENSSYPGSIKSPSTKRNSIAITKYPLEMPVASQNKIFCNDSGDLESQNPNNDSEYLESDDESENSKSENLDEESDNDSESDESDNDSESDESDNNSESDESDNDSESDESDNDSESDESDNDSESDESGNESESENLGDDSENLESDSSDDDSEDLCSDDSNNESEGLKSDNSDNDICTGNCSGESFENGDHFEELGNNATTESSQNSTLVEKNNSTELRTNFKNESEYTEPLKVPRRFNNILEYIYRHSRNSMFTDIKKQNITI